MLKKIIVGLMLGACATMFILQNDQQTKNFFSSQLQSLFADNFDCRMTCVVSRINFFSPFLELENIKVGPQNSENWSWSCKKYRISFSWWHLVRYGAIYMRMVMEDFKAVSALENNTLAIVPHIEKLIEPQPLPVALIIESLSLNQASFTVKDTSGFLASIEWKSQTKLIRELLRSTVYIKNGTVTDGNSLFLQQLSGHINIDVSDKEKSCTMVAEANFDLPQLPDGQQVCFLSGEFKDNVGCFVIKNADRSLTIDPFTISALDMHHVIAACRVQLPFSYIARLFNPKVSDLEGFCTVQMMANLTSWNGIHGQINLNDVSYKKTIFASQAKASFSKTDTFWKGGVDVTNPLGHWSGSWSFDESNTHIDAKIANSSNIDFLDGSWHVAQQDNFCFFTYDPTQGLQGKYSLTAYNKTSDSSLLVAGLLQGSPENITITGHANDYTYRAGGKVMPSPELHNFDCKDEQGIALFSFCRLPEQTHQFSGTIYYPLLKLIVQQACAYDLQGEGDILITGNLSDNNKARCAVTLEQGNIRLAQTYNFINDFKMDVCLDSVEKKITIDNFLCKLHKGAFSCRHATMIIDDNYRLSYVHMPFIFDNCLLNFQKDLFTIVSGELIVSGDPLEQPVLKGHLFLERSQLKANLLSQEFQKKLFSLGSSTFNLPPFDVWCDITIETKDPVRVNTAFLETNAKVSLSIKNRITDPAIGGFVSLTSGMLAFPYKPLYITKGKITFVPGQLQDPLIELVAKNKIKKYNIAMYAVGSLQSHHITLASTPSLTEEQIIGLLLAGSQEESLGIVMPALLMHNIKSLIFDSEHSPFKMDHYFKQVLAPLRHVHLVPSFSDQTGRGGLRGAIEVDIGDRWRGLIQKNFSLSEDTRFELEYSLSDEVSVRGFRDERQDLGAEIELRWKF